MSPLCGRPRPNIVGRTRLEKTLGCNIHKLRASDSHQPPTKRVQRTRRSSTPSPPGRRVHNPWADEEFHDLSADAAAWIATALIVIAVIYLPWILAAIANGVRP